MNYRKKTLIKVASAIAHGKNDVANEILTCVSATPITHHTQSMAMPCNSNKRLTDFLLLALKLRLNPFKTHPHDRVKRSRPCSSSLLPTSSKRLKPNAAIVLAAKPAPKLLMVLFGVKSDPEESDRNARRKKEQSTVNENEKTVSDNHAFFVSVQPFHLRQRTTLVIFFKY
ncbi:hypothetical protein ACFE04_007235 [Oxalis oulophora]